MPLISAGATTATICRTLLHRSSTLTTTRARSRHRPVGPADQAPRRQASQKARRRRALRLSSRSLAAALSSQAQALATRHSSPTASSAARPRPSASPRRCQQVPKSSALSLPHRVSISSHAARRRARLLSGACRPAPIHPEAQVRPARTARERAPSRARPFSRAQR